MKVKHFMPQNKKIPDSNWERISIHPNEKLS